MVCAYSLREGLIKALGTAGANLPPRPAPQDRADPAAVRAALDVAGVSSENISDDRIRSRLQGAVIERVMDRAKSAIYRAQPKTVEQRAS
jgi:hypothetical protein